MKKILVALLAFTVSVALLAQEKTAYEYIAEDNNRAGVSAHSYEPSDTAVSPAPKGYTAFYVSHIGRHGSRNQTGDSVYKFLDKFQECADKGLLTEYGMKLLDEMKALKSAMDGKYGQLTERGALEHRQIAGRMMRHYPEVFTSAKRNVVNAYNTTSQRVIDSRNNFLSVVSSMYPSLDVKTYVERKMPKDEYAKYKERVMGKSIPKELKEIAEKEKNSEVYKDAMNKAKSGLKRISSSTFIPKLFRETTDETKKYAHSIVNGIYKAGLMNRCAGIDTPAYDELFNTDYYYYNWISTNASWYFNYSNCPENTNKPAFNYSGKNILKYIIQDADEAVKPGSNVAADLRFSHDVKVLPLLAVIAPETLCYTGPLSEAHEHLFMPRLVCMGCNIQFIFYKNKKNDVIVKMLQNEKEVLIPGVKAFDGYYYKWEDLRKDLLKKTE